MRRPLILAAAAALLAVASAGVLWNTALSPGAAQATASEATATRTATFAVENMTCALCPVTVKKAMQDVEGVVSVEVDYAAKTATVAFDPALTTAETISAASRDAGYPARLAEQESQAVT